MSINRIQHIFILTLFLLQGNSLLSQTDTVQEARQPDRPWVNLSYQVDFDAPGLNNQLLLDIWRGGYIAPSRLEDTYLALSRLGGQHKAGLLTDASLNYSFRDKRDSTGTMRFIIGVGHTSVLEATYDQDLFGLMAFGNKVYAGTRLQLGDQAFRSTSLQHLSVGKYWSGRTQHAAIAGSISLGFLKGQYNHEIDIRSASIYTEENGDFIDIDMQYAYMRSDTQYTAYFDMNGYGIGIGAQVCYHGDQGIEIHAGLQNLGALRWVNNRYQYEKDSAFTYNGWEIPNIFDTGPGSIFENATPDSAVALLTSGNTGQNAWRPAPARVEFTVTSPLWGSKARLRAGFSHYLFTMRSPQMFVGPEFRFFKERLTLMPFYQYGGYGGSHAGMELAFKAGSFLTIQARSGNIDALFSPSTLAGQSLQFSILLSPKAHAL